MAAEYTTRFDLPVTGGSDAHILQEIGSVVTGVRADSVGEFLDGIRKGRSIVIGSPSGIVSRGMTAGVIAYNYLPYSATALHTRLGPHTSGSGTRCDGSSARADRGPLFREKKWYALRASGRRGGRSTAGPSCPRGVRRAARS